MKYLRITGDILATIIMYILYVITRQIHVLSPWRTIVPFEVWKADSKEMTQDYLLILITAIGLTLYYFIGIWWMLALIATTLLLTGLYMIISLLRVRRYLKRDYTKK